MEGIMRFVKRAACVVFFALVSFAVLAYGIGKFDFIFIKRDLPISGKGNLHIEMPPMTEDDKEIEEQVGNMGIGENISGIISSGSNENKGDESAEDGDGGEKKPALSDDGYYPTLGQAMSSGYFISTDGYIADKEHTLAEILLDVEMTRDQVKGKKPVLVDAPVSYEDGGEYFYGTAFSDEYCFSFEVYMGYILMYDEATATMFDRTGKYIVTFGRSEMRPAYARDEDGNPLFIDYEGRYFIVDEYGRPLYSSYVDERDSKGLYYNYRKDLSALDSPLKIFSRYEDVRFIDEINTKDYYIRSSIDPDLAEYIYAIRPSFAETVARSNPRFALALRALKDRIEEEKRLEEERLTAQLTLESDTLLSPDTESIADTELSTEISTETAPSTETESETVTVTVTETEIETETETEPETETETETETEIETEAETETELELETEKVTSSDPNILIIDRTLSLMRYGFGYPLADPEEIEYKYAKAYGYSEGRAAVVDDDGILRFIDPMGEVVIDGVGTKMVTASRYIVSEYAEPLYRHSENSKGYLYFDEGLVRVRKLERDYTFRNLIYSDSDVLLYPDGSEFPLPSGFTLVSYSEGVLVLKGNDGKYGYYHKNGYWIAQPIYTEIRPFSEGLGVIGFLGGKKGVIDINGNIVIPFAYEYITAPSDGVMTLYSYDKGWKILVKMEK